jgi:phosphomannomutase
VGLEANGGVLLGSDASVDGKFLKALPTRDAVLPILATLGMAARRGQTLEQLVGSLSVRPALADRLIEVPTQAANGFVTRLVSDRDFAQRFFTPVGLVESVGRLDGAQVWLRSGEIVHYRASGNAPELRCYVEAGEDDEARRLMAFGMKAARDYVQGEGRMK